MTRQSADDYLVRARAHLIRVQDAWYEPTDWESLTMWGFYCLEAAVLAAAIKKGVPVSPNHPAKQRAATQLAALYGLPPVADLLAELNTARKSVAYGDVECPDLDPEDVASRIEQYVDAVAVLLAR